MRKREEIKEQYQDDLAHFIDDPPATFVVHCGTSLMLEVMLDIRDFLNEINARLDNVLEDKSVPTIGEQIRESAVALNLDFTESTPDNPKLIKPWHNSGKPACQYCDNYWPNIHFPADHRVRITGYGALPSGCSGMLHIEAQPAEAGCQYDFLIVIACDLCEFVESYEGFNCAAASDFVTLNLPISTKKKGRSAHSK